MTSVRIVPCLDVKDGRVVKGVNFVDLVDAGDAVENAVQYEREGADEIVFLDITATYRGNNTVADMVRRVAERLFIPFTVGGGVRSVEDMRNILRAGADKVYRMLFSWCFHFYKFFLIGIIIVQLFT